MMPPQMRRNEGLIEFCCTMVTLLGTWKAMVRVEHQVDSSESHYCERIIETKVAHAIAKRYVGLVAIVFSDWIWYNEYDDVVDEVRVRWRSKTLPTNTNVVKIRLTEL